MEVHAFLGLMGHYGWFIKGFAHVTQLLNEHLTGEGSSRKFEQILLSEGALKAFEALERACMTTPILAFADYTKPFLLETDASKDGLVVVLSQKQMDEQYHPVAYGRRALMPHEKNYHSTKLEFLALKWVVTEHFKECLLYNNNKNIYLIKPQPNNKGFGGAVQNNDGLKFKNLKERMKLRIKRIKI